MDKVEIGMIRGIGYVLARVMEQHREDVVVRDVMKSSGYSLADFKQWCDPDDYRLLARAVKGTEGDNDG